jgi:hypothetical protein
MSAAVLANQIIIEMKLKNDVRWVGVFKTVPLLLLELGFFCVA